MVVRVTAIQPSITYYTRLFSNRAVPGTVWNWRAGLGLGRLDRDDLELARELGLLVEDARKQLAGILVRGRVPRSEGLVGLVDDVVEGGHCDHKAAPWSL